MRFARLAGVGIILGSFSSSATKPTVTLVGASPVVIAGTGYSAGAKFFITYRSGATQVRRHVVASLTGRYRVVLKRTTFKRCSGLRLLAPGASLRVASCAAGGYPAVAAQRGGLVTGSAFVPTERVALSARMRDLIVRRSTTAGRSGAFRLQMPWPRTSCTDIDVRAVGALGSTASFKVVVPTCKKP